MYESISNSIIPEPAGDQGSARDISVGDHFRYKVMPVGEDGKAHPLQVDPSRPLAPRSMTRGAKAPRRE